MIGETANGHHPSTRHTVAAHGGILAPLPGPDRRLPKAKCVNPFSSKMASQLSWTHIILIGGLMADARASDITNMVRVTPNIECYLSFPEDDVCRSEIKSSNAVNIRVAVHGKDIGTNIFYFRSVPYGDADIRLFDQNGQEVPKTKDGIEFSKMPHKPTKYELGSFRKSGFFPVALGNGDQYNYPPFRPEDEFAIMDNRIYELEVRARLCMILTNGVPDLSAITNGANVFAKARANDFDIFTCPPLRIRVKGPVLEK